MTAFRPSHADATYDAKYGIRAVAGGGRSSARETIGRVAAGAIAKKLLKQLGNTEVCGAEGTGSCLVVCGMCLHSRGSLDPSRLMRHPVPRLLTHRLAFVCHTTCLAQCSIQMARPWCDQLKFVQYACDDQGSVAYLQILAYVNKVREVGCSVDNATFTLEDVESTPVRCPDPEAAERMYEGADLQPVEFMFQLTVQRVDASCHCFAPEQLMVTR